jgi:hypothetical protein
MAAHWMGVWHRQMGSVHGRESHVTSDRGRGPGDGDLASSRGHVTGVGVISDRGRGHVDGDVASRGHMTGVGVM